MLKSKDLADRTRAAAESVTAELAPIKRVLHELDNRRETALDETAMRALAMACRNLAEEAMLALGASEATKLLLQIASCGFDELRDRVRRSKSSELADLPAWRVIEDAVPDGRGRQTCIEAVLTRLGVIKKNNGLPRRPFIHSLTQFFRCPGCQVNVGLKASQRREYVTGKEVTLKCPVCGTIGQAVE